jgi:hypothetical protein
MVADKDHDLAGRLRRHGAMRALPAKRTNSQLTTPMAHASMPAAASPILSDSDMITLKLDPFAYAIARNETSSVYSVSDRSNAISETLLWAFGVGNKGQTYIYQRNGSYYESRMSFYKSIHGLDLTPGDEKCLACHLLAPAKKITTEHPGEACPVAKKNCVTCHMPRVTIPCMHAPFTDHRIRIARPGAAYPN